MRQSRNLKLDLIALGLLAATVFLAGALLTYDPADPPSTLVSPPRAETLNVCGRWGAAAADGLFAAFGLGAYYLLVSLAALDVALLSRRTITQPVVRAVGWMISLVGLTTVAAMAVPQLSPGPVIGSGGYLGAAGCGLLLSTDYLLVHLFAWTVAKPGRQLGRSVLQVTAAYAQKAGKRQSRSAKQRRSALAVDDLVGNQRPEEDDRPRDAVAVHIAGRPDKEADASEPAEAGDSAPEQEPSADADAGAEADKPSAIRSMLRIRNPRDPASPERREVIEQLDEADTGENPGEYELPSMDLLLQSESFNFEEHEKEVRRKAKILEKTFTNFGFNIRVVEIQTGPVIAQFEVELEAGLRLSRITGLADDLAIALRVPSVRIVAPLPGKNTVGIEVPNSERQIVRLREVMEEAGAKVAKLRIPIFLGKDVAGNPMIVDLSSLPHLLIAGRTGTGKSVCLNSIIISMLMTRRPDEVRMLMIDPKMVELSPYKRLPHLMHPVVTDMQKAEAILGWAVDKMEERYALLARAGVRHISSYNQLGEHELMERMQPADDEERKHIPGHIPYIVIVADEMADLMMTAAKEVESHIIRLAQKSRAVGIHLVLATQKPTVDVITGLIKSNLPARIAFQVASRTDSRVVLDEMGADKLLGNGDMLFLWPGTSTLIRGQGTYLSDDEINRVIGAVATSEPQFVKELVQLQVAAAGSAEGPQLSNRDDLYEAAIDIVVREGRGSVSLLQRALGIGYGRAARLIDFMAEDGIVGPYNGSQAREILLSFEEWQRMNGEASAAPESPKPRPSNKIMLDPQSPPDAIDAESRTPFDADETGEEDWEDDYDEQEDDRDDRDEDDREDGPDDGRRHWPAESA
jgi:S-DNA-T family DNA segregation ATPase FtsK/SpoIIIE